MTWQENYQIWADRTDLPQNLQDDMKKLAADEKAAEDAFTNHFHSERLVCVAFWVLESTV